jgi:hypothetical protein
MLVREPKRMLPVMDGIFVDDAICRDAGIVDWITWMEAFTIGD